MEEMLYNPYAIAYVIRSNSMGMKECSAFILKVWQEEKEYLPAYYRKDRRKLYLDVMFQLDYMENEEEYNTEFPRINRDLADVGSELQMDEEIFERNLDLFFMTMRLNIVFTSFQGYQRMKLRTLLRQYGYSRRSSNINMYFVRCFLFYHIETFIRGGVRCSISDVDLDDMIIFRVVGME